MSMKANEHIHKVSEDYWDDYVLLYILSFVAVLYTFKILSSTAISEEWILRGEER